MYLLTVITGVLCVYNVHTSRVFVKTPYNIEDGKFLIFEKYHNEIILNEYPTFYSRKNIPKCMHENCYNMKSLM